MQNRGVDLVPEWGKFAVASSVLAACKCGVAVVTEWGKFVAASSVFAACKRGAWLVF